MILSAVDHTILSQTATAEQILRLCDEGIEYKTASVCIPPCYVKKACDYTAGRVKICTVIGFPNGYNTTSCKIYETSRALEDGADEIDMVINLGLVKSGEFDAVENEISQIKSVCGDKILKVIIETCLLTETEKIRMCGAVSRSGADFIKTSTGFSKGGAAPEDIILFKKHVSEHVRIKAAGGIKTISDAARFLELGADRLGTSRIIKLLKEEENKNELSDTSY